jgi:transposase InsO family protein
VYCAVMLDTFSRQVVGWSIDSCQTAALVTNALGMAIANRDPQSGGSSTPTPLISRHSWPSWKRFASISRTRTAR